MAEAEAQAAGPLLLIGRETLRAGSTEARAAVERLNARRHTPAFPDAFNPDVIDLAKYDAMVAALAGSAASGFARPMALDPRRLRIGTSAPTTPRSFVAPLGLKVVEEYTDSLAVEAMAAVDCGLARSRAAEAREMTQQAERDVAAATARRDSGTDARVRRWAVARVWEENAAAAAGCAPGDAGMAADLAAATKATDAAVMLGGSMR